MTSKEPIDWERRAKLWEQRTVRLWQLLDDIDTLGDSMRPPRNAYFKRVNDIARKRGDVLHSDGYTLYLPLGGSDGRIAELEAEVSRGRALINRDRTGLATALAEVLVILNGFRWLQEPEGWGSYPSEERTLETLRRELSGCFDQLRTVSAQALAESGDRANSSFHDGPHVSTPKGEPTPVPMILYCPMCTERHVDEGEFETKVHHTHSCQSCGHTWRPAVVPTIGVMYLPGFKNESATALSDEELGRRLWAFAVDIDGAPDAQHAEALGRRARQLVPGLVDWEQRDQLIELFHQLWGLASGRQYDKSLWARMQRLLGDG